MCNIKVALHLNLPDENETEEHRTIREHWSSLCAALGVFLTVSYESQICSKCPWYRGAWYHSQYSFVSACESLQRVSAAALKEGKTLKTKEAQEGKTLKTKEA